MNLKFPADITADDYFRAELLHQGWTRILSSIIFIVAMIFLISTNICSWRGWKDLPPILILVALLVYVCWRASAFGIKRRIRKIYLQQKSLQISRELTLADESLITRSAERGEWKIPWGDFLRWKANEEMAIVYSSRNVYHLFPRRWFPNDASFQEFKELLRRQIGPAGKARR